MNRFRIASFLIFLLLGLAFLSLGFHYWLGAYIGVGALLLSVTGILGLRLYSQERKLSASLLLSAYALFLVSGVGGLVFVLPETVADINWWLCLGVDLSALILIASFYGFWKAKAEEDLLPIFRASIWGLAILSVQSIGFYLKNWDWDTELSLFFFGFLSLISIQNVIGTWIVRKKDRLAAHPEILAWGFARFNPFSSFFDQLERFFGIDIKGTWAIQFVRASIEPLLVGMVLVAWLASSLFVVHPNETGVRENFGRPEPQVLESGLHWKLPFPFGEIRVASSKEVQQLSIGHEEAPSTEADVEESEETESILWANQHADEEFLLLLGDGHDLISADGVLQYRISNLHQYLYQTQNPGALLRSITYRVLMQETVSRTLEEALSENLQVLARRVNQRISEELAGKNIGIEPVLFSFSALHPPVKVAKDYQEVISAQIDRDTKVLQAEGYRLQAIPRAEKEALIAKNQAREYWAVKRAGAVGESFQFEALRQSVRQNTGLYLFRKRQESLERNLKGRSLVIIDHRLEQAGAEIWIQE